VSRGAFALAEALADNRGMNITIVHCTS